MLSKLLNNKFIYPSYLVMTTPSNTSQVLVMLWQMLCLVSSHHWMVSFSFCRCPISTSWSSYANHFILPSFIWICWRISDNGLSSILVSRSTVSLSFFRKGYGFLQIVHSFQISWPSFTPPPLSSHMGFPKPFIGFKPTSSGHICVVTFAATCLKFSSVNRQSIRPGSQQRLLQPLPIPTSPWKDLSLDFITGSSQSHKHTVILVIADRFSKGIHLGVLPSNILPTLSLYFF